jgi:hypothetical protein
MWADDAEKSWWGIWSGLSHCWRCPMGIRRSKKNQGALLSSRQGFELLHFGIRSAAVDHDLRLS